QKKESVANFTLRLKQGAAHCEYGEFLDRMLIEQLLHGLDSREMCDEIIAKKPTTFTQAYEIANTLEATRSTSNEVKTAETSETVEKTHKVKQAPVKTKYNKQFSRYRSRSRSKSLHRNQFANARDGNNPHPCQGCGERHRRVSCPFRKSVCHKCSKVGHIAKVCRSGKTIQAVQDANQATTTALPAEHVDTIQQFSKIEEIHATKVLNKQMIMVKIDGHELAMELDTGAPCSIVNENILRLIKPDFKLCSTDRKFASYTGHHIECMGYLPVNVSLGTTSRKLKLYVVKEPFDTLLGREWIAEFTEEINLNKLFSASNTIHSLSTEPPSLSTEQNKQLEHLLARYENIFSNTPGKLTGSPVSVHFKPGATPIFSRAREVPLALRDEYAKEIEAKLASGFYERVEFSEWASTTHIVTKKNGKIRITGNYKPTLNQCIVIDEHPIPKPEHLFNKMKNANLFCHLDITDAYTHLPVDEKFAHALTLNTPTHGLIRPKRAVYGAANIPAIWQRRMETVLRDLPNVLNFFDDILLFADGFDNLMIILDKTLERLQSQGLRLNRTKCVFASTAVEFLGHKIDSHGIHKSDKHIEALRDAPKPSTKEEL
ncbi:PREDICTED: uncharacterized protein K02A2.6-like, partial [Cyphomyrmex costatus]|uniref:uncharacterized protein K02A2.6-like n=1 Tax=Cyphomyrmex costatus TaxID=456900 RepID=UPI000852347A